MILQFFARHPMLFFMSKYKAIFKLRGFDFMNYIYIQRHKLTWQVAVMSKGVKNYMQLYDKN